MIGSSGVRNWLRLLSSCPPATKLVTRRRGPGAAAACRSRVGVRPRSVLARCESESILARYKRCESASRSYGIEDRTRACAGAHFARVRAHCACVRAQIMHPCVRKLRACTLCVHVRQIMRSCVRILCVRACAHYSAPTFMRFSLTSASSRADAATKLSSSTATLTCRITCARDHTYHL